MILFSGSLLRSFTRTTVPRTLSKLSLNPKHRVPILLSWQIRRSSSDGRPPRPQLKRSNNGRWKWEWEPERQLQSRRNNLWGPETHQRARNGSHEQRLRDARPIPAAPIVVLVLIGGGIFYAYNLEYVPVSGRRRFNCYSDKTMEKIGQQQYELIMSEVEGHVLPDSDKRTKMVKRVLAKLIPATGLEDTDWVVHVIDNDETMNAFVIPGGKVFVFSGILPIAKDDDGLASILGHEIAHNIARHQAEHMSSYALLEVPRFVFVIIDALGLTLGLPISQILGNIFLEFFMSRPASRKQESEADYIGLLIMAKACYNPSAAVGLWQRMNEAEKHEIPTWLSTHPSHSNRIDKMKEWLPEAESVREESSCAVTLGFQRDFEGAQQYLSDWQRVFGVR